MSAVLVLLIALASVDAERIAASCSGRLPVEYSEAKIGASEENSRYLQVDVPVAYQETVDQLYAAATRLGKLDHPPSRSHPDDLEVVGTFDESSSRRNIFFKLRGKLILLTEWSFGEDGAKLCIPKTSINIRIGPQDGTLALASTPGISKSIWKLRWIDATRLIQYELYLQDELSSRGVTKNYDADFIQGLAVRLSDPSEPDKGKNRPPR